jgi:hypothetical protein
MTKGVGGREGAVVGAAVVGESVDGADVDGDTVVVGHAEHVAGHDTRTSDDRSHIGRSSSQPDWSGSPLQSLGCVNVATVVVVVTTAALVGADVGIAIGDAVGAHVAHVVMQLAATRGFVRHCKRASTQLDVVHTSGAEGNPQMFVGGAVVGGIVGVAVGWNSL